MSKWANDVVMDAGMAEVAKGNLMMVCTAQPTNRADAMTIALASATMVPGNGNGDYTVTNGTSGRKVTMTEKPTIPVDSTGNGNHIALVDDVNLIYVTTCTPQQLTAGNTVTFPTWSVEIGDPT